MAATNPAQSVDYSQILKGLISSGGSIADVQSNLDARNNKIANDSSLSKYANDAVTQQAQAYINANTPKPVQQVADNSGFINGQYDDMAAALKAKIQQSMNDKTQQIAGLDTKYQPQKNNVEVQRYTNLRSVLEQNANAGDRGGVGRQNALETQTSADNQLNDIVAQRNAEESSLRNDIANLALEGDIQGAQIASEKLKALIADKQYVDQTNYGRSQDAIQNAIQQSGLTGYYNGQRTMQGQQFDIQAKQQQLDNLYREKTFDYQKSRDTIADTQWQKSMDLNLRQQSFAEAQQKIENALAQRRISQEDASQALQWAKFNADQDPNSLDNQIKLKTSGMTAIKNKDGSYSYTSDPSSPKFNSNTTFTIDDWGKTLDNEFLPKYDSYGSVKVPGVTDQAERENRILALGLPYDMTRALYQRYNIPLPK